MNGFFNTNYRELNMNFSIVDVWSAMMDETTIIHEKIHEQFMIIRV